MPTQTRPETDQQETRKSGRGFAAMDANKQREIASKGGKAAHESGRAHEFTSEEARVAGRKGGEAAHESGRAHEFTSEEARAAGRKGGEASHANRAMRAAKAAQPRDRGEGETASPPTGTTPGNGSPPYAATNPHNSTDPAIGATPGESTSSTAESEDDHRPNSVSRTASQFGSN